MAKDELNLIEDRVGKRARVRAREKGILVGVDLPRMDEEELWSTEESMKELESLADTAGVRIQKKVIQRRKKPDPSLYIGSGKAEEIREMARKLGVQVIIFNDELRPAQSRNLEEKLATKIVDRTQLIMDIFAQRAQTKEAKLQVELAQYEYLLPRLRGWGESLERQEGGIGTRGPGQTRLARDREKVQRRIDSIKAKLKEADKELDVRSKRRLESNTPIIALIGYTNSGKTTLLNRLTGSEGFEEDKLFATLDPLTRKFELPDRRTVLLTDTVGLIRKLPHQLIPAFRSTLKSARTADLLVNMMDATQDKLRSRWQTVNKIINEEIFEEDEDRPPMINVLNKIDLLEDGRKLEKEKNEIDNSIAVSARAGKNLDRLKEFIAEKLGDEIKRVSLNLPYSKADLLDWFHQNGEVIREEYGDDDILIEGKLELHLLAELKTELQDGELEELEGETRLK
ncbi:MAG: GTPase HflX [Candidatus Acetothermia bacterium]